MGLLVEGKWHDRWYSTDDGRFRRSEAAVRNWITADGSAGPSGREGFEAQPGRYHLYVAYACPWAHRTLLMRKLKGLEDIVTLSVVHWFMGEQGWTFEDGPGVIPDEINGVHYLHELYTKTQPDYSGRVTVPILWDKERNTMVSNESAEIIRMFNSEFAALGAADHDFYPETLRSEIDALNDRIYPTLNDGVYRTGFATTQEAYEEAVVPLFETLDDLEQRLATRRFLTGASITEADVRLWPTLLRFDLVYHYHFKCNLRRLRDYPNLWGYTRDLWQQPGWRDTTNLKHAKDHYFQSHPTVNPTGVVPLGPVLDLDEPHARHKLG